MKRCFDCGCYMEDKDFCLFCEKKIVMGIKKDIGDIKNRLSGFDWRLKRVYFKLPKDEKLSLYGGQLYSLISALKIIDRILEDELFQIWHEEKWVDREKSDGL